MPAARRVFRNGEAARARLMRDAASNGMRASVNGMATECGGGGYESQCGIQVCVRAAGAEEEERGQRGV